MHATERPDDSRPTRPPRPAPPRRLTEIERLHLDAIRRQIEDIDAGREGPGVSWEEAKREIFAPATPEELAAIKKIAARALR
jgi:hypothetical protein